MIRLILISIFFLLFSFSIYAQIEIEDVIYLNNGGVTRGVIMELIPDKTIKIQTREGDLYLYEFNEIKMVAKEKIPVAGLNNNSSSSKVEEVAPIQYKQSGYYHLAKLGSFGLSNYSHHVINGYQFNPYLLVGLGVGLDTYRALGKEEDMDPTIINETPGSSASKDYFLPIYFDVRYNIKKSKTTFFTFFDFGYSIYLGGRRQENPVADTSYAYNYMGKPSSGGVFVSTGIGFKTFVSPKAALFLEVGLRLQSYEAIQYQVTYNSSYYYSNSNGNNYQYTASRSTGISSLPMINFGVAF